jgi:dolichyl-phosphate-mannose--protein O-mannosyl transferase
MWRGRANKEFWILLSLTLASVVLRFWQLGQPGDIVFDETYYAKWGQDYLQGEKFFDVHPPLGKFLIGVGVFLFGSDPANGLGSVGWRFAVALFGVFIVPLTYFIARKLFSKNQNLAITNQQKNPDTKYQILNNNPLRVATLSGLFVLIDGLILVQTRTALLDSFLVTFSLAAYLAFLHYREATSSKEANLRLLTTGFFLGLALATKWTGIAPFAVISVWWWTMHRATPPTTFLTKIGSFGLIPFGIYIASFALNVRDPGIHFWPYLIDWHKQTWNFHEQLIASHPYESRWWSWLYLARPVWYYFKQETEAGPVRGILALGNPILWWASIPALLAGAWYAVRHHYTPLLVALLAFLATYVPWILIGRTQFQYYLVGGVPFMMIILAWWIDRILSSDYHRFAQLLIVVAIFTFIFFFPLYTAMLVPNWFYKLHIWFPSWI